jgi:hypothetical protein
MSEEKKKYLDAYVEAHRRMNAAVISGDRQAEAAALRECRELAPKALTRYDKQGASAAPGNGVHESAGAIFARRRAQAADPVDSGSRTSEAATASRTRVHDHAPASSTRDDAPREFLIDSASVYTRRRHKAERGARADPED